MSKTIPVKVFKPVGVCSCSQTAFYSRIYGAIRKYAEYIDYQEYSADCSLAKQLGINYRGVVVGNRNLGSNPTEASIEAAIQEELKRNNIEVTP